MRREVKISLIIAAVLLVAGLTMMAASLGTAGIKGLDTSPMVTNTYEIRDPFRDLDIAVSTAEVEFLPSWDGSCKVVCHEEEKLYHSVAVRDGVLCIQKMDEREWYDHIGIHTGDVRVTVYLPPAEYGGLTVNGSTGLVDIPEDLYFDSIDVTVTTGVVRCYAFASEHIKIRTSTGSIRVGDITTPSVELSVTTGRIDAENITCDGELRADIKTGDAFLTNVRCGSLLSDGSAGDIRIKDVIAGEKFDIRRTTGDVEMDGCDAPVIVIETSTGKVTGTVLTGKIFETHTSTGEIQIPKSVPGGECQITTSTGDIRIGIG